MIHEIMKAFWVFLVRTQQVTRLGHKNIVGTLFWNVSKTLKLDGYKNVSYKHSTNFILAQIMTLFECLFFYSKKVKMSIFLVVIITLL